MGVGGGGGNAVVRMTQQSIPGVEFWCLNTDAQVRYNISRSVSVALVPAWSGITYTAIMYYYAVSFDSFRGKGVLSFEV